MSELAAKLPATNAVLETSQEQAEPQEKLIRKAGLDAGRRAASGLPDRLDAGDGATAWDESDQVPGLVQVMHEFQRRLRVPGRLARVAAPGRRCVRCSFRCRGCAAGAARMPSFRAKPAGFLSKPDALRPGPGGAGRARGAAERADRGTRLAIGRARPRRTWGRVRPGRFW
jgi:hypothetical protein